MTEAVKIVTFINIIFVVLFILSGMFPGIIGELIYYLAFFIPIFVGFHYSKGLRHKREEVAGVAEPADTLFSFDKRKTGTFLPLVAPAVLLIFLTSLLTSLILSAFGVTAPLVEDKGIAKMLISHALFPAFFEEALFRYIPMKLLLPYSKRWCVVYSALCFALIHCSFYQMPYAFLAGILFMLIDISYESVWPSVILHFINNSVSVVWMKYCSELVSGICFATVLVLTALVSIVFIFRRKEEYKLMFVEAMSKGEKSSVIYAPFALAAITFYIALINLY